MNASGPEYALNERRQSSGHWAGAGQTKRNDDDDEPPAGVEPATWWVEATCSIQLSYGGKKDENSP